jgi:histidinol-phosphatase (PHP family)
VVPSDRHVHTEWSWDAPAGSMERTCARAVELGLRSVAFTDHADFTVWTLLGDEAGRVLSPPALPLEGYFECLLRCRERFPELEILSGVELSEPHWHSQAAASLLGQGGFDLVICGQHSLHHGPDAFIEVSDGYRSSEASAVVRSYLTEVGRMMDAWDDFEVLAHIDYPVRSWPHQCRRYQPGDFEEEFRAVLRALARSGRVLEVNTRVPLHAEIIRWWRQEGGRAVSFGSDAHDPLALAHGFADAAAAVEASGFRPGRYRHDFWMRT